jgi:capsular polysaccharide biosynthesis protein
MTNEPAVAAALSARGFKILDPMRLQAAELVQACANAQIVVGIEGSHLAHGIVAMRRGGTLVALQPPARFSSIWKGICEGRDLRYAFAVGHPQGQDFSIDIDALNRLLDRVLPLSA